MRRNVSLGLVVVVIRNEVFDGVLREKSLELRVELGGQGLVVCQHEGRASGVLDDVGYGEGLSRAGYPQQGLGRKAAFDPLGELADSFRLVAGRTVVAGKFELHGKRRMFFPLPFAWIAWMRGEIVKIRKSGQKTFSLADVFPSGKAASLSRERGDEAASGGVGKKGRAEEKALFFVFCGIIPYFYPKKQGKP